MSVSAQPRKDMNRTRFQPVLSLAKFLAALRPEAACARALRRARWLSGLVCVRCGHLISYGTQ